MSMLATEYHLYHANSNTLSGLKVFNPSGVELTPQTLADGTDDPEGWKVKVIVFENPVEAVFVTPVWQDVNNPLPVYLTRTGDGDFNVMDEEEFDTNEPGRPSPKGEYYQQYSQVAMDGGVARYEIIAPISFAPKIKPRTKDLETGERLYGNEYLLLWGGKFPDNIEVQVDLEDLVEPNGYYSLAYENITEYAEASSGKCLVRVEDEVVPEDGLTHLVRFRIRYNFSGDLSEWVESDWLKATYILPPPEQAQAITVTVLRDRENDIPDRIRVDWVWGAVNPGDAIEVYAIDTFGKKHLIVEESDNAVSNAVVENVTRFYTVPRPPAVQTAYRFGVVTKNRTTKSAMLVTPSSVMLTSRIANDAPPTPDEIAGTAEHIDYATLIAKATAEVSSFESELTPEQRANMAALMSYSAQAFITALKKVVMRGGSAIVQDFGVFRARWADEKVGIDFSTGLPVTIPAKRCPSFLSSIGYRYGTARGEVLTDLQAKALP